MGDDWSKVKEKQVERIKSLQPHDRLSLVESIAEMNQYIAGSCQGWIQWLYNPMIVGQLSQDKLEEIFNTFRKLALEFLTLDITATRGLGEKLKKHTEKSSQTSPTYG